MSFKKNWQLRRFLLMVVFSGKPALSIRIELKSKYGEPPMTLAEQAYIMNTLGLRHPEYDSGGESPNSHVEFGRCGGGRCPPFYALVLAHLVH